MIFYFMTHQIRIYKASAGSGKTFNLARDYITLLLEKPFNYKRILAVTFTNKAAEEMKSRIISELYNLADNRGSDHVHYLTKKLEKDEKQIRSDAEKVLYNILHDYGHFSIFTIDAFFQQILKAFTREIGIQGGYRLEIEEDQVLQDAIDRIIRDIENDTQLKQWLISFAHEKMQSGKSWHIRNDLSVLAEELFKESFNKHEKKLFDVLSDHQSILQYRNTLIKIKNTFEERISDFHKKAYEIIQKHGITENDFKGKTRSPFNLFNKFRQGDFTVSDARIKAMEDETSWYTKTNPSQQDKIVNCLHDGLLSTYKEMIRYAEEQGILYDTAQGILKQIYTLGILHAIHQHIYEITKEQNIFLLQDTGKLLKEIIGENDTPFVYEKIGNVYDYLMIDEFQDTSITQWENFIPLFVNNMSKGFSNLVVGDIKQSIYRWRNSDWSILSEKIEKTFSHFSIDKRSLQYNWRSLGNIVSFNNTIFLSAKEKLQEIIYNETLPGQNIKNSEKIKHAYEDYFQEIPMDKNEGKGFIQVSFLEAEKYYENTLDQTVKHIETLQQKGVPASNIAILTRKRAEGEAIAAHLYQHKNSGQALKDVCYDVVSNEVLRIEKSLAVRIIITVLTYLTNRKDQLIKTSLLHLLKENGSDPIKTEENIYLYDKEKTNETIFRIFGNLSIKDHSLYELAEQIFSILKLNEKKEEIPYLDKFMDVIYQYGQNYNNDIYSFLQWWEEKGVNEALSVSENQDAIRIYTIHKSKGLEFDAVIIPFADWSFDYGNFNQPILWCHPEESPFNAFPVVPMKYSDTKKSLYFEDYLEEKTNYIVDTLNVFYVGATRARNNLIILTKQVANDTPATQNRTLNSLLYQSITEIRETTPVDEKTKGYISLNKYWDEERKTFTYGSITPSSPSKEKQHTHILAEYPSTIMNKNDNLRLKNHGNDFFEQGSESAGMIGTTLHTIFNKVREPEDFDTEIQEAFYEGLLNESQMKNLSSSIKKAFETNPQANDWFAPDVQIFNEREILTPGGDVFRPDRVVISEKGIDIIDYKFGKREHPQHKEQIKNYASLLQQMGYTPVRTYLWYVTLEKIEEVEITGN